MKKSLRTLSAIALLCLLSIAEVAAAESVQVAVAANFRAPMVKLAAAFGAATGHVPRLSFGSTGKLAAQIRNGAPFEVLLAADQQTPAQLEAERLAVPGSRHTYAIGKLVLWSARPGFVDAQGEVLRSGNFDHLALANPRLAPYGEAAMQVLAKLGLLPSLQSKLVFGESIAQAHQFVFSGNAEVGILALSQVMSEGNLATGSVWVIPEQFYEPVRQELVILTKGKDNPAALALVAYLKSSEAKAIIGAYGYEI